MNRTYVVVGGSTGIGSAVLDQLVSAGEQVVQLSRHPGQVIACDGGLSSLRLLR